MRLRTFLAVLSSSTLVLTAGCDILGGGGDEKGDTTPTPTVTQETKDSVTAILQNVDTSEVETDAYVKSGETYVVTDSGGGTTKLEDVVINNGILTMTVIDSYIDEETNVAKIDTIETVFKLVEGDGTTLEGSLWEGVSMTSSEGTDTMKAGEFRIFLDPATGELVTVGEPEGGEDLGSTLAEIAGGWENVIAMSYTKTATGYQVSEEGGTLMDVDAAVVGTELHLTFKEASGGAPQQVFSLYDGPGGKPEGSIWEGMYMYFGTDTMNLQSTPPFLAMFDEDQMKLLMVNVPDFEGGGDSSSTPDSTMGPDSGMCSDSGCPGGEGPAPDSAAVSGLPATVKSALDAELQAGDHIGVIPYIWDGSDLLFIDTMGSGGVDTMVLQNATIANDTLSIQIEEMDESVTPPQPMTMTMWFVSVLGGSAAVEGPVWQLVKMGSGTDTKVMDGTDPAFTIYLDSTQSKFFGVNFPK